MDIIPIGMIAVLLLLLVEMGLASKWSPFYFNNGIKLYSKHIGINHSQSNMDDLSNLLNTDFRGSFKRQNHIRIFPDYSNFSWR